MRILKFDSQRILADKIVSYAAEYDPEAFSRTLYVENTVRVGLKVIFQLKDLLHPLILNMTFTGEPIEAIAEEYAVGVNEGYEASKKRYANLEKKIADEISEAFLGSIDHYLTHSSRIEDVYAIDTDFKEILTKYFIEE